MLEVKNDLCFTGQVIEDSRFELVRCARCNSDDFINVHSSGWFDRTFLFGTHQGAYVHYGCLPPERIEEIRIELSSLKVKADFEK